MVTILRPYLVKTEVQNPWKDKTQILTWNNLVSSQLNHRTSHIKAYGFDHAPIGSLLPYDAEIVGVQLYLDHDILTDGSVGTQTIYDKVIDISQSTWLDTGIDVNGEDLTFICTWSSQPYKTVVVNKYQYPEGYYSDIPLVTNHTYDMDVCVNGDTIDTPGFPLYYAADNCRPLSCIAYVATPGELSGLISAGLGGEEPEAVPIFTRTISNGMQLNRATTYDASRMPNAGVGRLILIFNDKVGDGFIGQGQYANNHGSFNVKVIKGSTDKSRLDVGIGVRSGYDFADDYYKTLISLVGRRTTVLGSPTDMWGRSSWDAQELNTSGGIILRRSIMTGECTTNTREIDSCWLVVYWNEPGGLFGMAERESVKQKILFGKETTKGTVVACTNRAMGFKANPSPHGEFKGWRPQGNKAEQLQMLMREWATSSVNGVPNYTEMGYLLASVIGKPVSTGGVVDTRNVHTFRFDNRFEQDIQTYTCEYGTPDSRAHRVAYGFFDSIGLNFTRAESELSGSMISRAIVDGITMSAGNSDVQTLTVTGTPTGGTFKLRFKGAETSALAFDATGATIQTALNLLSTIGASGVGVSGGAGGPWVVTFSGTALTGMQQPLLELSDNSLSGGTTPSISIVHTTVGGFVEDTITPILPGQLSVYLADTYATLAAGKLTRARMANWSLGARATPYWIMDAALSSFFSHVESPLDCKVNLELEADSNGMGLLTTGRTGAGKFLRVQGVGPVIGVTSDVHKITIDMFCKVSALGNLEDADGIYQTNYELSLAEDLSWGNSLVITLENGKIAY